MSDFLSTDDMRALSSKLQALHGRIVTVERRFEFGADGKGILDRLTGDPAWAWLRALSSLIADIDHATAGELALPAAEKAVVASHVRGLLFGEGADLNDAFLERYRPLLQKDAELASLAYFASTPVVYRGTGG